MEDISESKKIYCERCKIIREHFTSKTFENKIFDRDGEHYFMDSYSMLCCKCLKSTAFCHRDIITDDEWRAFSHEKITSLMNLKINNFESNNCSDLRLMVYSVLNNIVHSEITKFEIKLLFMLIQIETFENKFNITQKEFLTYYNEKKFDELEHLDQSIKQSQLSRSLKSLEKQKYINIVKLDNNQRISLNLASIH